MRRSIEELRADARRNAAFAEQRRRLTENLRRIDATLALYARWDEHQHALTHLPREMRLPRFDRAAALAKRATLIAMLKALEEADW